MASRKQNDVMMLALPIALAALLVGGFLLLRARSARPSALPGAAPVAAKPGKHSDDEWRRLLSPEQFRIIRENGTEIPFTSPLDHEIRPGTYYSADCGVPLFRSEQKYDSGTGWPSFWAPIDPKALTLVEDDSIPLEPRTEVRDAACDGHLGHVFDDGPPPTGKRYCMNGAALRFVPDPQPVPTK
jgi:peptide-methionine (R)-S-oxide reductase